MCRVSHGSLTPKARSFGSFSIHFEARGSLHLCDPHPRLPETYLSLGLDSPCVGNRELPNGFHPGGPNRILDAEDQDYGCGPA
jgi:hypothetical protein